MKRNIDLSVCQRGPAIGFMRKRQLRFAAENGLSHEFLNTILIGYSDAGSVRYRSAAQMKTVRQLLKQHRMRFSTITLLGLSDEVLQLYQCGFSRDLSLRSIHAVIDWYRAEAAKIREYACCMAPGRVSRLIMAAFHDAERRLAHMAEAA